MAAAFCVATLLPFLGKAYHVDEPFYLAVARQIQADPLHPTAFSFNWYGRTRPMSRLNTQPTFVPYLFAPVLAVTGGAEWRTRLAFLPFNAMAAVFLYLLAARFLKHPLLPTLVVLAGPAFLINTQHLMAEKWLAAFGFAGLYYWVLACDEERPFAPWIAAVLLGAALLVKYSAVFLVPTAAFYAWRRRVPPARAALFLGLAASPVSAYLLWGAVFEFGRIASVWTLISGGMSAEFSSWVHRLRALLAFSGGCCVVACWWPAFVLEGRTRTRAAAGAAACAALVFLPLWDVGPVAGSDRALGILMAWGGLFAWAAVFREGGQASPGRGLWTAWIASVAFLQLFVYWSVVSRFILFLMPPTVFGLAQALEARSGGGRRRLYGTSLAAVAALGLCLAWVDRRHADAQKEFAQALSAAHPPQAGLRLWYTGHWGFQYYLEGLGAQALDGARGGWDEVRAGDLVAVPAVNTNVLYPAAARQAYATKTLAFHPLPLRLMSRQQSQAAFYSSVWGFMSFAGSREPVEEFTLYEPL